MEGLQKFNDRFTISNTVAMLLIDELKMDSEHGCLSFYM